MLSTVWFVKHLVKDGLISKHTYGLLKSSGIPKCGTPKHKLFDPHWHLTCECCYGTSNKLLYLKQKKSIYLCEVCKFKIEIIIVR